MPPEVDALKFLIEIDRRGSDDAVFYDCYNPDFEDYILQFGFHYAYGSFSDISYIAPELNVAAVNLSSGYYNAHTQHEYIVRSELANTISKVIEMVTDAGALPQFEYTTADFTDNDYYYSDYDYFRNLK